MWPWQTMLASAVGAAVPLIPVYIFGFRQIVASKEATIEQLTDRIEQLKAECAPTVVVEKRSLIADLEARAKEKAEAEEVIKQMVKNVEDSESTIKALNAQVLENRAQILETTAKVGTIPGLVKEKISGGSRLGVLTGVKSLMRVRYWWHGLALDRNDPIAEKLDAFIEREVSGVMELQIRIRDGHVLTTEDFAFAQEEMNHLRDQARSERKALESREQIK